MEFDESLSRGLHRYLALVAEALGLTGQGWSVQPRPPATGYLALDRRTTEFPDRDTALLWDERTGWSLVAETPGSGEMRTIARLPGDVLPPPQVVARFARDAAESAGTTAPEVTPASHPADVPTRLAAYARPPHPPEPLTVSTEQRDGGTILVIHAIGEIDMTSAPSLTEAISHALREHPEMLIVNFTGVRFLGSAGLNALVQARQQADRTQFRVVASNRATLLPLQLTGLDTTIAVYPTLTDALTPNPNDSRPCDTG